MTRDNPLLANATETVNKLGQQLDELNVLVQRTRSESRIMNQYKDLIEKSRQQFAQELKSILPNVDIHAKGWLLISLYFIDMFILCRYWILLLSDLAS